MNLKARLRTVGSALAAKEHRRRFWVEMFVVCFAVAVVIDLALVFTGRTTISFATWVATQAHPTLVAAGMLATVYVGYLVRANWRAVLLVGILGGHLFVHW